MSAQNPALFMLASLLSAILKPEQLEEIQTLQPALAAEDALEAQELSLQLLQLNPEKILALHSDYIDLFDRGHAANPIYETEYGRNRSISKTTELADLAGFYQAFGLASEGQAEMPDHLSVELEFYAWLLLKQQYLDQQQDAEGLAIVTEARHKFLQCHLGGFASQVVNCPGVQTHPFYLAVFDWIRQLVAQACSEAGIEAAPIAFFKSQSEGEEFGCASLGGCGLAGLGSQPETQTEKQKEALEV